MMERSGSMMTVPMHSGVAATLLGRAHSGRAIVLDLIGRSEDMITACITTAIVLVVAGISPEHAWKQPILRLIDTVVGIAGGWIALKLSRLIPNQSTVLGHAHKESIRS
jgi:hypothetical protein